MPNALRIVAWIIGALLAVLAVAFAWGRLRPPTPAQAETLGLLRPMPMPSGQNAWPILWLLDYDVPTDRIDAVYAQERAHMRDWASRLPASPSTTTVVYKPLVAAHYPKRPAIDTAEHKLLCASREDDCLAKARAEGRPLRDLLARQSGRLAQVESMNAAAALWDDLPISNYMYAQLPGFANTEDLLLTATAVDFVDGRQAQALAAVCRQAAGVRRLHAQTNTLITAMIANAWMEADERVLAGMLRELPPGHAVPAECMQAFAPPTPAARASPSRAGSAAAASRRSRHRPGSRSTIVADAQRLRGGQTGRSMVRAPTTSPPMWSSAVPSTSTPTAPAGTSTS